MPLECMQGPVAVSASQDVFSLAAMTWSFCAASNKKRPNMFAHPVSTDAIVHELETGVFGVVLIMLLMSLVVGKQSVKGVKPRSPSICGGETVPLPWAIRCAAPYLRSSDAELAVLQIAW